MQPEESTKPVDFMLERFARLLCDYDVHEVFTWEQLGKSGRQRYRRAASLIHQQLDAWNEEVRVAAELHVDAVRAYARHVRDCVHCRQAVGQHEGECELGAALRSAPVETILKLQELLID